MDGWRVSLGGEAAVEQDVSVEQGATASTMVHLIVAFHEYGVKAVTEPV